MRRPAALERRMLRGMHVILALLSFGAMGSVVDDDYCNYVYDEACSTQPRRLEDDRGCNVDNIVDDIKFTVLLGKENSQKSDGIMRVNFTLPNADCNYQVALLVNVTINNNEDCKNHVFHKTNSYQEEIHSLERTVCVMPSENRTQDKNNCKDKFSIWYDHVFTGCYALRFTVDGYKYSVLGNRFITTNYSRKEVEEPKFRCYYEDRSSISVKQDLVNFALSISVHGDSAGMVLSLTPMAHNAENSDNACVRYSQPPLYTLEISTIESVPAPKNCSLTTVRLDKETYTRNAECNLALPVPQNVSYCLKIGLADDRCNRQTIWKPPPDREGGRPACAWLQSCTRIYKNDSSIEFPLDGKSNFVDGTLILPIAFVVILLVIIVGVVVLVYCMPKRSKKIIRIRKILDTAEMESVDTLNDDIAKKIDDAPIVLLYARGTSSFMNLMLDFREIIKIRCGCPVRDWYDSSEWDAVARIGPAEWVADLLKNDHRALWIDTPTARALLDPRNTHSSGYYDVSDGQSDFRDLALRTVLDFAKRSVTSGYNKHFVVRFEGLESAGSQTDPFEDLCPHTRYLIPHHLSEFCAHISSWLTTPQLTTEEESLRVRLLEIAQNS